MELVRLKYSTMSMSSFKEKLWNELDRENIS